MLFRSEMIFNEKKYLFSVAEFYQQEETVCLSSDDGQDYTLSQRELCCLFHETADGKIWGRTAQDEHYICVGFNGGDIIDIFCYEFQLNFEPGKVPFWTPRLKLCNWK